MLNVMSRFMEELEVKEEFNRAMTLTTCILCWFNTVSEGAICADCMFDKNKAD